MGRVVEDVWGVMTSFWPAVCLKHLQSGLESRAEYRAKRKT